MYSADAAFKSIELETGDSTVRRSRAVDPPFSATGLLTLYLGTECRLSSVRSSLAMSAKRRIEIFSAGCALCGETIAMVRRLACP
jgi:hypothetical protein